MSLNYHPAFDVPEGAIPLWRYMGIGKYLALLTEAKLYFTKLTQLGDPWEGELPEEDHRELGESERRAIEGLPSALREAIERRNDPPSYQQALEIFRQISFVNCWHESEYESAAMWKIYGEEGLTIAVVSTLDCMRRALSATELPIVPGRVKYIDYKRDRIAGPGFNFTLPMVRKRKSFEFEKEVRLVHFDGNDLADPKDGIHVAVDLSQLILRVMVSPDAASWYVRAVAEVTAKYGISAPVLRSNLNDPKIR